jgi:hypothetical protein
MNRSPRVFQAKPAEREQVPLLVGLVGPSGSGKTFSALRLAEGIRSIVGGEIVLVDTEARRALHYAADFRFQHLQFDAPFGSLDYLDALRHCATLGAGVVIVDSMSHEHEGPGGLLEFQEAELTRIAGTDEAKRKRSQMLAWAKPKAARRQLINEMLQLSIPALIFCFRAKEKIKPVPGKEPENLGWMPIAGEEFVFEMTMNCLLTPASKGCPDWNPSLRGELQMVKMPGQFAHLTGQLDEAMGAEMALWASGAEDRLRNAHANGTVGEVWKSLPPNLKRALDGVRKELKAASETAQEQAA